MKAIIYKITNDVNNKIYVGQTWKTAKERFDRHCAEARWRKTKDMPIVLAIKKYGKDRFKITIVEECNGCTQLQLDNREVFWAKELNAFSPNGYNLKAGQSRGILSEETKKKIGESNKGKKRSPETVEKLRVSHLGYVVTDEAKKKLSNFNKGKKLSDNHKNKIAISNTGKIRTEEAKEKMRAKKLRFFYCITAPNGEVFNVNNLMEFCRQNNLNAGHMSSVANSTKLHYKNWRVTKSNA